MTKRALFETTQVRSLEYLVVRIYLLHGLSSLLESSNLPQIQKNHTFFLLRIPKKNKKNNIQIVRIRRSKTRLNPNY